MKIAIGILILLTLTGCQQPSGTPKLAATASPSATIQATASEEVLPISLEKGQKLPDFEALDSQGRMRSLADLQGKKRTLLVVYRSADW